MYILFRSYVERDGQVVVALEVERLGAADSPYVVREPDHRGRSKELRGVEYTGHLFRVVSERERREMWRRIWICSRRPLRCSQVV